MIRWTWMILHSYNTYLSLRLPKEPSDRSKLPQRDALFHQEKRFCAPKSRQKSQHFTTSLDSVWLHLDSVWVSLTSWCTITTLLSTSEGPVPSFYFLSEFIRQFLWLLIHFCMRISEICASICSQHRVQSDHLFSMPWSMIWTLVNTPWALIILPWA